MTILTRPMADWRIADTLIEPAAAGKAAPITQNTSNTCVGRRLRLRRTSSGISKGELCDKLGIDRNDLDAYEQGAKRVNANLLLRVAKLFNVQPEYFFQGYSSEELSVCLESPL
jgi:ribosome-binding protein aMBF1 (putative translation factor)